MRFGAFVPHAGVDLVDVPPELQWDVMVSVARVAEETGFESVWVSDHFHTSPKRGDQATWEALTVLAGLAEATSTIRLGPMCMCASYRSPAYLAKVAASIDAMSGGRLEMGVGAGWYEDEYRAYGYDFPSAGERVARLAETVAILKAMWTGGEATFAGDHYAVNGALCLPRPAQEGGPPLWIAGGGEQKTLRVVAEHADYANYFGDRERFERRTAALQQHCRDVGRDFGEITLTRNIDCLIAADEEQLAEKAAVWIDRSPWHETIDQFAAVALFGTPDQVAEQVAAQAELGFEVLLVEFVDATWGDGMRVFAEQVIPAHA